MCWIGPRCLAVQVVFSQDESNCLRTHVKPQPIPDEPGRSFGAFELEGDNGRLFTCTNFSMIAPPPVFKSFRTMFQETAAVVLNRPWCDSQLNCCLMAAEFARDYVFDNLPFQSLLFRKHGDSPYDSGPKSGFGNRNVYATGTP